MIRRGRGAAVGVLALAACLDRPTPQGKLGDGGMPDATSPECQWYAPVEIVITAHQPTDALVGPWLSDDRTDLWYTLLPLGSPPGSIYRAHYANGVWTTQLAAGNAPSSYANPFYDESRDRVWFDKTGSTGPPLLAELDPMSGAIVFHNESGDDRAPSLMPDGTTMFLGNGSSDFVLVTTLTNGTLGSTTTLLNPGTDLFSSPSVTRDGAGLYLTDRIGLRRQLVAASLTAQRDAYATDHLVGTFQLADKDYYDPSISRDGLTLAFASNFAGGQPRLYYTTRDQDCAP